MVRWLLVVAVVLLTLVRPAAAQDTSEPVPGETGTAGPDPIDEYQSHLDVGIRLYKNGDYNGAIAEFKHAYALQPKASPLINLALSYKKRSEFAEAIAALEKALTQHADTLAPDQKVAAELEIDELRRFVAWVTVRVEPEGAKNVELTVDDKPAKAGELLPLSPGGHRFVARASGYEAAETRAELVSGKSNATVLLRLKLVSGHLSVHAVAPGSIIEIDNKPEAKGKWDGLLSPGVHVITVHSPGLDSRSLRVAVVAGGEHAVTQKEDGALESDAALPGAPPPPQNGRDFGVDVPKSLFGFYGVGGASLLTLLTSEEPITDRDQRNSFGGAIGVNVGYRVANWAAFELFVQGSDVSITGKALDEDGAQHEVTYALQSLRAGPLFRTMLPGASRFRFLGATGLGVLLERFDDRDVDAKVLEFDSRFAERDGVGFFGEVDLGVELEFSNVLIDVVVQNTIQTTKHLDEDGLESPFKDAIILLTGPSVRVGYGLW